HAGKIVEGPADDQISHAIASSTMIACPMINEASSEARNATTLASFVILDGDHIWHVRGFGVANDSGRPVTSDTSFEIGSVTKSFTALAVMQLVEDGHIDLDTSVQRYIPWFRIANAEMSRRITVRHLLNQTSGLSEIR